MTRLTISIPETEESSIGYQYQQFVTIDPDPARMRQSQAPSRLRWWLACKILKVAARMGKAPAAMLAVRFDDDAEANKRNWIAVAHTARRVGPLFLAGLGEELISVQVDRAIAKHGAKEPAA